MGANHGTLNNFFITVSSNLLNPGKIIILCVDRISDWNNFVTWNNTKGHQKWTSSNRLELCWVVCCKKKIVSFVNIHTANNFENIVNHNIKFGRSLTNLVIGNHMNTPNSLNYA